MILSRRGSKAKIAEKICSYFPKHDIFIDMFFGAGGLYFNKIPRAKYNILNDIEADIANIFEMLKTRKFELYRAVYNTPYHESIFKKWIIEQESDPIWKAVRYLYLSNYSLYGSGDTIHFGAYNHKKILLQNIQKDYDFLQDCQFMSCDFRDVLRKVAYRNEADKSKTFIYADPPYINTFSGIYNNFNKSDVIDLFNILVNSGIKFAISEFDDPFILEQAKQHNLNVIIIGERLNVKNRRTEILITNYELEEQLF